MRISTGCAFRKRRPNRWVWPVAWIVAARHVKQHVIGDDRRHAGPCRKVRQHMEPERIVRPSAHRQRHVGAVAEALFEPAQIGHIGALLLPYLPVAQREMEQVAANGSASQCPSEGVASVSHGAQVGFASPQPGLRVAASPAQRSAAAGGAATLDCADGRREAVLDQDAGRYGAPGQVHHMGVVGEQQHLARLCQFGECPQRCL